jgi:hypothetical protein
MNIKTEEAALEAVQENGMLLGDLLKSCGRSRFAKQRLPKMAMLCSLCPSGLLGWVSSGIWVEQGKGDAQNSVQPKEGGSYRRIYDGNTGCPGSRSQEGPCRLGWSLCPFWRKDQG